MSSWNLGFSSPRRDETSIRREELRHPLRRILAFTRLSIDDVVNNPVARRIVAGYYKLSGEVARTSARVEHERKTNPHFPAKIRIFKTGPKRRHKTNPGT